MPQWYRDAQMALRGDVEGLAVIAGWRSGVQARVRKSLVSVRRPRLSMVDRPSRAAEVRRIASTGRENGIRLGVPGHCLLPK
jgi:hypothetical protein